MTSHGPSRESTSHPENQEGGRRKRSGSVPPVVPTVSAQGCEQRFRPRRPRQRYRSEPCRKPARAWSRWKAQSDTGPKGGQTET